MIYSKAKKTSRCGPCCKCDIPKEERNDEVRKGNAGMMDVGRSEGRHVKIDIRRIYKSFTLVILIGVNAFYGHQDNFHDSKEILECLLLAILCKFFFVDA